MTPAIFRKWRQRAGLLQRDVAEAIGVSPQAICRFERDDWRKPMAHATVARAKAFILSRINAEASQ